MNKDTQGKHTGGNWKAVCLGSEGYGVSTDLPLKESLSIGYIALCTMKKFEQCKADSEHIAHIHNNFEALREALELVVTKLRIDGVLGNVKHKQTIDFVEQALANSEENQ